MTFTILTITGTITGLTLDGVRAWIPDLAAREIETLQTLPEGGEMTISGAARDTIRIVRERIGRAIGVVVGGTAGVHGGTYQR